MVVLQPCIESIIALAEEGEIVEYIPPRYHPHAPRATYQKLLIYYCMHLHPIPWSLLSDEGWFGFFLIELLDPGRVSSFPPLP